jgi:hypothetical protein
MSGAGSRFGRGPARTALLVVSVLASVALAQVSSERTTPPSLLTQTLAPLLASWIAYERDAAKQQGVEPIPGPIRAALAGHVPEAILDRVRWRVGASDFSLPQNVLRFGHVPATTLDYVIVFAERRAALEDPKLWAHELKHVMQFAEWGIDGFAARYVEDYEAVEQEAVEFRWEFMRQAGLIPKVSAPHEPHEE